MADPTTDTPLDPGAEQKTSAASQIKTSAEQTKTAAQQTKTAATQTAVAAEVTKDSADRRTELAADRTVFAAERTYAAWVRTGLAALASGIGAEVDLPDDPLVLFGEGGGQAVVACAPAAISDLEIPARVIGSVGGATLFGVPVDELRQAYEVTT